MMQTAIRKSGAVVAIGVALLAACQGSVPNQVLTKPAPVVTPPPVERTSGPWAYRPSSQRQAFVVDQRAVLSIRTDTVTRIDSLASHAELGFVIATAGGVSGTVGAYSVRAPGLGAATPPALALPFPFRGDYLARGTQLEFLTPRDGAPCASKPLSVVQSLRDLWFRAPDTLRVGTVWDDSLSYVICRDGIPLRASSHRAFRVTGMAERDGHTLLTVARTARTSLDGSGAQFGEAVRVSGAGSGELTYELDATRGEVLSATGRAVLDFSLRSRLRTQTVHQTAEIRIGRS